MAKVHRGVGEAGGGDSTAGSSLLVALAAWCVGRGDSTAGSSLLVELAVWCVGRGDSTAGSSLLVALAAIWRGWRAAVLMAV